jgi:Zn-dependent protease/predicted transcriptional regulator
MFRSSLKILKVFGIEIRLDYSWFVIFALIAYLFGFSYFPNVLPGVSVLTLVIVTILTALLFFLSVLIHEMSHSLVAKSRGIPVNRITLFIFGGMAQIEKEPDRPGHEFAISIAGPLASFVLAALFGLVWLLGRFIPVISEPARYLTIINIALGIFNLLPGFPLDGGRVLRSIIWKSTGNFQRATHIASNIGRVIGFAIMGVGVVYFFIGALFNGLWLLFIGWFLQSSAGSSYQHMVMETSMKGIKVKDLINDQVTSVSEDITIKELVEDWFMKYRFGRFPVVDDHQRLIGVMSINDIKHIERDRWDEIKLGSIVKRVTEKEIIDMDSEISDAIKKMSLNNIGHLVVLEDEKLIGMLTRTDVMRFIQLRSELS